MKRKVTLALLMSLAIVMTAVEFLSGAAAPAPASTATAWMPNIPRAWDPKELEAMEVPLTRPEYSPHYLDASYYYSIPTRPIYKSYPVYAPSREPAGYMEWIAKQEPEIAFDPARLKAEDDWTRAGEIVFDAPIIYANQERVKQLHDPKWYQDLELPVAADGTVPYFRYVVREKGRVEVGRFSCGMCHTRVMPDGSVIRGAQGNFPNDRLQAMDKEMDAAAAPDVQKFLDATHASARAPFGAPWLSEDPAARFGRLSFQEILRGYRAIPAGVQARFATSLFDPVQVPDLIGIKDRAYLDRTGLMRHRSLADLMRYAIINQGGFLYASHKDFQPNEKLPPPAKMLRYSDEQLYALSLYVYSLKPPTNPNKFDALATRGKKIFAQEGCDRCHTPPLYTNNQLVPVNGFQVTREHPDYANIKNRSVGTDEGLALRTRRGTGFYKIPSLKGLWYRGPLEHSGRVATLEEWLDPKRLSPDFVSKGGYRSPWATSGAVRGHEFGLDLTEGDRKALIAFLRTL
jgi:hypothetical protein